MAASRERDRETQFSFRGSIHGAASGSTIRRLYCPLSVTARGISFLSRLSCSVFIWKDSDQCPLVGRTICRRQGQGTISCFVKDIGQVINGFVDYLRRYDKKEKKYCQIAFIRAPKGRNRWILQMNMPRWRLRCGLRTCPHKRLK